MATSVVTVNDILDGHVGLDLECFDRIYLNGCNQSDPRLTCGVSVLVSGV